MAKITVEAVYRGECLRFNFQLPGQCRAQVVMRTSGRRSVFLEWHQMAVKIFSSNLKQNLRYVVIVWCTGGFHLRQQWNKNNTKFEQATYLLNRTWQYCWWIKLWFPRSRFNCENNISYIGHPFPLGLNKISQSILTQRNKVISRE